MNTTMTWVSNWKNSYHFFWVNLRWVRKTIKCMLSLCIFTYFEVTNFMSWITLQSFQWTLWYYILFTWVMQRNPICSIIHTWILSLWLGIYFEINAFQFLCHLLTTSLEKTVFTRFVLCRDRSNSHNKVSLASFSFKSSVFNYRAASASVLKIQFYYFFS